MLIIVQASLKITESDRYRGTGNGMGVHGGGAAG